MSRALGVLSQPKAQLHMCRSTDSGSPSTSYYSPAPRCSRAMARLRSRSVTAAGLAQVASPSSKLNLKEKAEVLKEDLSHLFDDQGVDASQYDSVVDFRDPITKYKSLQGYLFNIKMLKTAFNPRFQLHDVRETAEDALTTRWTMNMEFTLSRRLGLSKWWSPTIIFTGTSTYVYNDKGKIYRHIDVWDSISNQEFFSVEGFADFFKQLLSFYTTPALETPAYTVLRRAKDYQVRRYESFTVAEHPLDEAAQLNSSALQSGQVSVSPAGPGMRAFNSLAGYIFGNNQAGVKMAMTTPVYSKTNGTMQFVIGSSQLKKSPTLPAPNVPTVRTTEEPGRTYAVRIFSGVASEESSRQQEQLLRTSLKRDGLTPDGDVWTLARYNDPSTWGAFRRNEVLIPLASYELW